MTGPTDTPHRPFWLHLGGDGNPVPTAVLLSVTASVRRHGLDPWCYLKNALAATSGRAAVAGISDLLPDVWARSPAGSTRPRG